MTEKTQEESEAPAKVYQIDAVVKQLESIESLIKSQTNTYITKDANALALQIRDAKIETIEAKLKDWKKLGWVLITVVVGLLANTLWQLVINTGRVQ